MKASELRIGNYLHDGKDRLCRVEELRNDERYEELEDEEDNDNIDAPAIKEAITTLPNKPIPLTEDWLLKFGFEHEDLGDESPYEMWCKDNVDIWDFNGNHWICNCADQAGINQSHFKYVHQLQNLYYALTGEELILTPSPG